MHLARLGKDEHVHVCLVWGFRLERLGVYGLGFRVEGLGLRVWGLGIRV